MDKTLQNDGIRTRKKIYDFLVQFITKNGYSPSIREICDGVGVSSTAAVCNHLCKLEIEGKIKTQEGKPRTISVVGFKFVKVG